MDQIILYYIHGYLEDGARDGDRDEEESRMRGPRGGKHTGLCGGCGLLVRKGKERKGRKGREGERKC